MKKAYEAPAVDVERFMYEDVLTNSSADIGTGDGKPDTLDDELGI
jgi:hypothetical protein